MPRTLGLALLALVSAVGSSQASFTEKGLSLLSYQLCTYRVTQNVQKVEPFQISHVTYASCGSWIPWRRCPKTVYRTQYLAVEVPESRNVTDCCEGYEQLGLYCVLQKGLSLLSYQLCTYRVTQNVQKVEPFQISHVTYASCGSWIPWRRCPKTVYRTQYLAVEVPESRNVTDCCEGYEQLGLYCVLPLNRSQEFASKPGVCPTAEPELSTSPCSLDTDCPRLQKCCSWSGGHQCVAPMPRAPKRKLVNSWYNVTVLVKMDFRELEKVDPRLLNHTRLLYSLVTNSMQPLNSTVHHLHSASGDTSTTVSQLLLGLPQPLPVANVSAMLDDITKRVYEVINIQVQDVNECLHDELSTCSGRELCVNMEGSHRCTHSQELPTLSPQRLNHTHEDCPPIGDYMILNVTSSSFQVSWTFNSTRNCTFHVQIYRGEELLRSVQTRGLTLQVAGLEAGVLYKVKTSSQGSGARVFSMLTVKTDARVFEITIRIMNRNLTEKLLNCSSGEYQDFSRQLLREVENSLPSMVSDLHRSGKLRMKIMSLQAGSVVVKLRLTVQDPELPVGVSTLSAMLPHLWASTAFQIDQQGTLVRDWDECSDSLEHDCSPVAQCINLEGSYTCQCRTARDANPSRPGRACEGDMVSPTESMPSVETGVMSLALSTGTTALDLEMPTLAPSPWSPWSTQATDQAWTLVSPPRQGDSDVGGPSRSSTEQGVKEMVPSTAPGSGMDLWNTSQAASTTSSPRAFRPTHSSPPRATEGLLDHHEQLLRKSTTEPYSLPFTTQDPTGHVSLSTQERPLNPTWIQKEDTGPSHFPDLSSAHTPMALQTPTCGPVSIGKITVSNVTSTSFHLAWVAGGALPPTFQLTLTSSRSPTMGLETQNTSVTLGLETQNTSVTLSRLEPGVLHLVEIVAKACGKEVGRAHLKVRTAAQKLRGQVRIANIRYSESFHNTSSKNYQEFLKLFFRMVQDSLPATLRRHMDTGGIRMEVSSITNGSIVVAFDLLISAEVDVREVSAAVLAALQNASLLEVVRDDTFIRDYDECERKEDDCVPGTSCRNTLGSFICICAGGASDFQVEYSGRPCKDDSSRSATPASSTEQLPTPAGTQAVSQELPQQLNLTDAVRVLCEIEKVAIIIQKRFLWQESIPESSLYLGHPSCNVSESNSTHVLLAAGWSECGTIVQSNTTNTVVKTTLRNDLSPEGIIHYLKILSPIHCAFQNDLLTSSGYTPKWGVYAIIEDLHGAGNFVTEMQLFIGDSPIPQNYSVSASDDVKIEVGLYKQKSNLKVVLTECWATPSSNARDPVSFGFINNSCPVPNTYTNVIENGNSSKAQFKLKIFSFINNSIVYLHCKLRVCMESPGATCKINCNNFRWLRSSVTSSTHQTSWGPLFRSEDGALAAGPGLGAGFVAFIAVAIFTVVAGAAALLVVRYQKMMGKYNFKIQSGNISYQVFHE
ncbi:uromodulin-like 1 [Tupaia chinensis]|uniref:uromodulin-like 1 n=1 Tax=Tupaia chinensis TaxID=246437 RepID=UPI000FFCAA48|nr:uromodulin-like 1 [Tupaia chinensis]